MRSRIPSSTAIAIAVALSCVPATAAADPKSGQASLVEWGWATAAFSVVAGGGVTAASLAITCPHDDFDCARWTSLGIWSGIGFAALGTIAGLIMVRAGSRPPQAQISLSLPKAMLVYTF
jgi:hypothetical protein